MGDNPSQKEIGMSGWQPYETVPKDGTPVDLWVESIFNLPDGTERVSSAWRVTDACWLVDGWRNTDGNYHEHLEGFENLRFTHWMMPPSPPAT